MLILRLFGRALPEKGDAGVGQMNGQMNAQGQQMVMMPMQNNMQQMQNGQMPQMMQQSRAGG